ncbi:sialidase family protein [Luteolibacter sp. SL250]|uniref:sialidase family protein n=1 Tax=Luteolibacter sp. SL250 TaxID=2995170 RepID=UPI00226DC212|nr:sialidase family protein [Luteolibacter sp. SL250]WAC21803.1 sialidase family protein [Luteolibacter sp. SL250]
MKRGDRTWTAGIGTWMACTTVSLSQVAPAEIRTSRESDARITARWCFEHEDRPQEDTAPAGDRKDMPGETNEVSFGSGIARIAPGGFLKINPGMDTDLSGSGTLWLRFKLPLAGPEGPVGGVQTFIDHGAFRLFLTPAKAAKNGFGWVIGAEGKGTGEAMEPTPNTVVPAGVWVQVALTVEPGTPLSRRKGRLYHRAELAGKDPNHWVYSGAFHFTGGADQPLHLKNGGNDGPLQVDEIKFIDRSLDIVALGGQWAAMKDFEPIGENPPGVVIDHMPAVTGRFIAGSPSIVIMDDGSYVAKGDDYGPATGNSELVRIHRSTDKGATWKQISEVEGITWASLFLHRGALYMMGTSAGHRLGHAVIMKSTDGGFTWTKPVDQDSGLIFADLSYHTAPVPVTVHNGRIWRTMEDEKGPGGWGTNFRAFMLNAPESADLLKASSWTMSNPIGHDPKRLDGRFKGWLEGNTVIAPGGVPVNFLRVSMEPGGGKAAVIRYSADGKTGSFDAAKDFVDFPGAATKFHILHDPESGLYWALSNAVPEKHDTGAYGQSMTRNTLVIMTSRDLEAWDIRKTLLYHPDISRHGFQYPVFEFEGNDIIFVARTSYDDGAGGAHRQHDANYFTFHRIRDFRKLASE